MHLRSKFQLLLFLVCVIFTVTLVAESQNDAVASLKKVRTRAHAHALNKHALAPQGMRQTLTNAKLIVQTHTRTWIQNLLEAFDDILSSAEASKEISWKSGISKQQLLQVLQNRLEDVVTENAVCHTTDHKFPVKHNKHRPHHIHHTSYASSVLLLFSPLLSPISPFILPLIQLTVQVVQQGGLWSDISHSLSSLSTHFTFLNVLYYSGAIVVMAAMTIFLTMGIERWYGYFFFTFKNSRK